MINGFTNTFSSRIDTLNHLLDLAEAHFAEDESALFAARITPDMLPFGTQIAFACDQARHFALWCAGQAVNNVDSEITTVAQARECILSTKALLATVNVDDAKLAEIKRIEVGGGAYLELAGHDYITDYLLPNFYFHLVTAYNVLRMSGVDVGKRNFLMHLMPFVKQDNA